MSVPFSGDLNKVFEQLNAFKVDSIIYQDLSNAQDYMNIDWNANRYVWVLMPDGINYILVDTQKNQVVLGAHFKLDLTNNKTTDATDSKK